MPKTNRWHPWFVRRYFVQRWFALATVNDERFTPNQRNRDLAEADQFADSVTRLEPDPDDAPVDDDEQR